MTDSRGNKAGEQSHKGKSLYNVKWNENPSITGPVWYSSFKKRSLPTSVSNSDYEICKVLKEVMIIDEMMNGELKVVNNRDCDYIDSNDYQHYRKYLEGKSCVDCID